MSARSSETSIMTAPGMEQTEMAKPLFQLQEEFLQWRFGLFIHFGMATFHDMQWATGHEDPVTFAPTSLDCGQWADAALAAGMTYAVLTVKHTSGWCLWQSDTTTHGMQAFTKYQNGKGDLFREFVHAFRARGMKVGFYYCLPGNYVAQPGLPPERQVLPPGKPNLHGLPPEAIGADPLEFMKQQFTELLTKYGRIDEVWLDQGGLEKDILHAHVKSLQPNCVVLLNNAVGDVAGFELPNVAGLDGAKRGVGQTPAEVADCINPDGAWFWQKAMESNLLTTAEIVDRVKYFNAHRANYLLDVPPDTSGLLPPIFVERLQEVGKLLKDCDWPGCATTAPAK
jgi:alpha-L-fucosidase